MILHRTRAARRVRRGGAALALAAAIGCSAPRSPAAPPAPPENVSIAPVPAGEAERTLDELAEASFRFFWDLADPRTGLVPDRWPTRSFASIAATGFGLTAYGIGAERGWVTREQARDRTLATLRFLAGAPQGPEPSGRAGFRGFYYHFLDPPSGLRFEDVELSTVDTALLVAGALFAESYFDRDDPAEQDVRELAETIYRRVEWDWARPNPPAISHGWVPGEGFIPSDWRGYNEAMIVYLLALGSPTHPVDPAAWQEWTRPYRVVDFYGQRYVDFPPLFGHHYTHVWVDFRGIRDAAMARLGWDYFENSRRATLAQRTWAIANPRGWRGIDGEIWGVSACDGPADAELEVRLADGRLEKRRFWTYAGRGVGPGFPYEDGTIAPTAAAASLPFTPVESTSAILAMRRRHGAHLWSRYGFLDSFNPTFDRADFPVRHGRVVPGAGWYDSDWLGIDVGPIVAMVENHRSDLVWRVMRTNPHLVRGLRRAGFAGGWLDSAPP